MRKGKLRGLSLECNAQIERVVGSCGVLLGLGEEVRPDELEREVIL